MRQPLEAEWRRRFDAATKAHEKAMAAWNAAARPVQDAVAAGVFVSAPSEGAPFKDASPAGATRLRAALGAVGATPCHVRDLRALTNAPTNEAIAAAQSAGERLTGPSAYQILCGTAPASDNPHTFLVTVPSRFVAAKVDGQAISGWHFEVDGHFADALRGRVVTIGLGEQLEITGIGRLIRGVTNPGFSQSAWDETLWGVDFTRACPHEGAGCAFNDGHPMTVVRPGTADAKVAPRSIERSAHHAGSRLGAEGRDGPQPLRVRAPVAVGRHRHVAFEAGRGQRLAPCARAPVGCRPAGPPQGCKALQRAAVWTFGVGTG